jgi:hypothetical protein
VARALRATEDRFEASGRRRAHWNVAPHHGMCGQRGIGGRSVDHRSPVVKEWSMRILVFVRSPWGCWLDYIEAGGTE